MIIILSQISLTDFSIISADYNVLCCFYGNGNEMWMEDGSSHDEILTLKIAQSLSHFPSGSN